MRISRTIAVGIGLLATMAAPHAETYPSKPIRWIVPFPAGSAIDSISRAIADKMALALGQPLVLQSMPGGGTVRATQYVARQPADGYTLLTVTISAAIKSAVPKPPFDIRKDLAFVGQFSASPLYLAVNAKLPVNSVQELIAYAKARPGALNVSSYGIGTLSHLTAELFMYSTGARMIHVPYPGSTANGMAVAQGDTQVTFDVADTLRQHRDRGMLRYLAVTSGERWPDTPELPTLAESGVPQVDIQTWGGIAVPPGTPPEIVARLSSALDVALKDPAVIAFFKQTGFGQLREATTPAQFAGLAGRTVDTFAKLIRDAHLDVE